MEFLLFPKKTYYLTQGYGPISYSHQGRYALDVSAAGGGSRAVYAPFTGYVAQVYVNPLDAYTIWLVSDEKVLCADNKPHYVVMQIGHPSEIADFKVGDKFKQGQFLMNDGKTGQATGEHIDLEIAVYDRKEDIRVGFYQNSYGVYGLINAVAPTKYLVLANDTKVLNDVYDGITYAIKTESEVINLEYNTGVYRTLDNIRVRTGPGINYPQKRVECLTKDGQKNATSTNPLAPAFYRTGTLFDALEIFIMNDEVWARTYSGYVNIIYKNEVNCEKI